jgi:hypothetical protein
VNSELEEEDIVLKDNEDKAKKNNRKKMLDKSHITLMQEEDMQHQRKSDSEDIHPRIELDKEMDGLWMLMRRTSKRRYNKKRRTTNKIVHLTERLYINKYKGQQHKVWNIRELEATTTEQQQSSKAGGNYNIKYGIQKNYKIKDS